MLLASRRIGGHKTKVTCCPQKKADSAFRFRWLCQNFRMVGLTGPICARAPKMQHGKELSLRGHQD